MRKSRNVVSLPVSFANASLPYISSTEPSAQNRLAGAAFLLRMVIAADSAGLASTFAYGRLATSVFSTGRIFGEIVTVVPLTARTRNTCGCPVVSFVIWCTEFTPAMVNASPTCKPDADTLRYTNRRHGGINTCRTVPQITALCIPTSMKLTRACVITDHAMALSVMTEEFTMRGLAYNPGILPAEMIIRQRVKPMPSREELLKRNSFPSVNQNKYLNAMWRSGKK